MDYATMQSILGRAAIAAALIAGGIVGVMLICDLGKPLWRRLARLWRRSPVECVAAFALLCYCVAWGGGKGKISFPRTNADYELLKDNGSYILTAGETNEFEQYSQPIDQVQIYFTTHPILPDTADVQVWRRLVASTNDADWEAVETTTVAKTLIGQSAHWLSILGGIYTATNYNWVVFTTWQPTPSVQTNGVLHVDWWGGTNGAATAVFGIPLKSTVETTEGMQLAPTRPNADE